MAEGMLGRRAGAWLGQWLYGLVVAVERRVKGRLFGCQMCGQCALRYTGFVCPRRCPKNLNNGPCGGSVGGRCEVRPEMKCVWVEIVERARLLGPLPALERELPPLDWSLVGTSSWLNHLSSRDRHLFPRKGQGARDRGQAAQGQGTGDRGQEVIVPGLMPLKLAEHRRLRRVALGRRAHPRRLCALRHGAFGSGERQIAKVA